MGLDETVLDHMRCQAATFPWYEVILFKTDKNDGIYLALYLNDNLNAAVMAW